MIHARDDYNRIQDPAGHIPEDEPVFLLRGQDALAPYAVREWAKIARLNGLVQMANMADEHAKKMAAWANRKLPDLPPNVALSGPARGE